MGMGPAIGGRELRKGFQELLAAWMPPVLAELARRSELELKPVKGWTRLPNFQALTTEASPVVVVTSTGLAGEPTLDESGFYSAIWIVNAFPVVRANKHEDVADLVGEYTKALRIAGTRRRIAIDGVKRARWIGEGYGELRDPKRTARTLGAGIASFLVPVVGAMSLEAPEEPPEGPDYEWEDDEIAEEVSIAVDKLG